MWERSGSGWAPGPWDSRGHLGGVPPGPLGAKPASLRGCSHTPSPSVPRTASEVLISLSHLLDVTLGSTEVQSLCGALFVGVISQVGGAGFP